MSNNALQTDPEQRDAVRSVTKLVLLGLWLIVSLVMVRSLPGIDRLVPLTPVTFAALIGASITFVIVALLFLMAPKIAALTKAALSGRRAVAEHAASVAYWTVILVAVVTAHRGFAGVGIPLLGGNEWIYDMIFLGCSLPPMSIIAIRLYKTLDPTAEQITEQFVGLEESDG